MSLSGIRSVTIGNHRNPVSRETSHGPEDPQEPEPGAAQRMPALQVHGGAEGRLDAEYHLEPDRRTAPLQRASRRYSKGFRQSLDGASARSGGQGRRRPRGEADLPAL